MKEQDLNAWQGTSKSWPAVFAQDIPQEAETTGNVCPAFCLHHASTCTIHTRIRMQHSLFSQCVCAFMNSNLQ